MISAQEAREKSETIKNTKEMTNNEFYLEVCKILGFDMGSPFGYDAPSYKQVIEKIKNDKKYYNSVSDEYKQLRTDNGILSKQKQLLLIDNEILKLHLEHEKLIHKNDNFSHKDTIKLLEQKLDEYSVRVNSLEYLHEENSKLQVKINSMYNCTERHNNLCKAYEEFRTNSLERREKLEQENKQLKEEIEDCDNSNTLLQKKLKAVKQERNDLFQNWTEEIADVDYLTNRLSDYVEALNEEKKVNFNLKARLDYLLEKDNSK